MTANNSTLTQARLKELLHYNPDTGVFTWIKRPSRNVLAGDIAGTTDSHGYVIITIDKIRYGAHRLVFLYIEGLFPPIQVDHINRIKTDNRRKNLRHATRRMNHENRSDNNVYIGVHWNCGHDKWHARTPMDGRERKHIGYFKTHLAACYARHAYDVGALK